MRWDVPLWTVCKVFFKNYIYPSVLANMRLFFKTMRYSHSGWHPNYPIKWKNKKSLKKKTLFKWKFVFNLQYKLILFFLQQSLIQNCHEGVQEFINKYQYLFAKLANLFDFQFHLFWSVVAISSQQQYGHMIIFFSNILKLEFCTFYFLLIGPDKLFFADL